MAKQSNKILILTGHSGAGKDAVSAELRKQSTFTALTPHTTRAMRENEEEGNPYYFISEPEFISLIKNNELIEYADYRTMFNGIPATAYYGTAYSSIPQSGNSVITIGVLAAIALKRKLGSKAILVYLDVPDSVREDRAKQRGSFDQVEWDNRLAQDHARFKEGLPEGIDITIDNTQPITTVVSTILNKIKE